MRWHTKLISTTASSVSYLNSVHSHSQSLESSILCPPHQPPTQISVSENKGDMFMTIFKVLSSFQGSVFDRNPNFCVFKRFSSRLGIEVIVIVKQDGKPFAEQEKFRGAFTNNYIYMQLPDFVVCKWCIARTGVTFSWSCFLVVTK